MIPRRHDIPPDVATDSPDRPSLRLVGAPTSVEEIASTVTDLPAFAEAQIAGGTCALVGFVRDLMLRADVMSPDAVTAELERIVHYWRTTAALATAAADHIGKQPWPDEPAS